MNNLDIAGMAFPKYGGALDLGAGWSGLLNQLIEKTMSKIEQTLSIIKPDAVERNLDDNIKKIFTENNLWLRIVKNSNNKDEAAEFYKVHQSKPFYGYVIIYPLAPMVYYDFRGWECCFR